MKRLAFVLFIPVLLLNCNKDKEEDDAALCKVTEYFKGDSYDPDFKYTFSYNDAGVIYGIRYERDDYSMFYRASEYSADGKVSKFIGSRDGVDEFYEAYQRTDNNVQIDYYDFDSYNDIWMNNVRMNLSYNSKGELLKYEYFYNYNETFELLNYIEYSWSNGNVIESKEYVPATSKKALSLLENRIYKPLNLSKGLMKLKSGLLDDVAVTFVFDEYDSNPNWEKPIGLFWPGATSANNVLSYSENYSDETIYNYTISYNYNTLGFPLLKTVRSNYFEESYYFTMNYDCN